MKSIRRRGRGWRSTKRRRRLLLQELQWWWQPGVQEASCDNSVDCSYAMPVQCYSFYLEGGRGPSTSRWAGPPAAGSGPGWAGWIQSRHCYCASGLLKLAGQTRGEERGGEESTGKQEGKRSRGVGFTTSKHSSQSREGERERGWERERRGKKEGRVYPYNSTGFQSFSSEDAEVVQTPDQLVSRSVIIEQISMRLNPNTPGCVSNPKNHLDAPVPPNRDCKDLPWEFLRPVTGIGSNSSSVPTSPPACWGSKSEIRRDESAENRRHEGVGCNRMKAQSLEEEVKRKQKEAHI